MLDKKPIGAIFLLEFKMGRKTAEITCSINQTHIWPRNCWWMHSRVVVHHRAGVVHHRAAVSVTAAGLSQCRGDPSQGWGGLSQFGGRPLVVLDYQLRGSLKLILLQLHEKLLKSSTFVILWSFSIWSRLKGEKPQWVSHELTGNLKNHHFEVSSSLIICNSSKLFHGLWYAMKSGFYTTGNDQLSGWT